LCLGLVGRVGRGTDGYGTINGTKKCHLAVHKAGQNGPYNNMQGGAMQRRGGPGLSSREKCQGEVKTANHTYAHKYQLEDRRKQPITRNEPSFNDDQLRALPLNQVEV